MRDLRLSEIWIYPVKSLGGIRVLNAHVLEKGLELDRRWMLVDESGKFMTQRTYPEMALLRLTVDNRQLKIRHKRAGAVHQFETGQYLKEEIKVTLWDDVVLAHEVNYETSAWFSDQLTMKCKLVFFPEKNPRPVDKQYAIRNEQVSLADGYPFLIIGQASLDDLNSRLREALPITRFRPNFVFTGGTPYEEDHWKNFSIGSVRFAGVKNCSRCTLTTVDPETGVKGEEPLRTLASYRKRESKVYFGQNAVALDQGEISEGDALFAIG